MQVLVRVRNANGGWWWYKSENVKIVQKFSSNCYLRLSEKQEFVFCRGIMSDFLQVKKKVDSLFALLV